MNIEDEKIFTILNCGVKYELPWKYLKRCDFFETLRQENQIPNSNIFELFTSPLAFPYILSYLINPQTIVPIEYKLDFAYFGIVPEFKNDMILFDKMKIRLDELENNLKYKIKKNSKLVKGLCVNFFKLTNKPMEYDHREKCYGCGSNDIKRNSGGYCWGCCR